MRPGQWSAGQDAEETRLDQTARDPSLLDAGRALHGDGRVYARLVELEVPPVAVRSSVRYLRSVGHSSRCTRVETHSEEAPRAAARSSCYGK